MLKLILSKDWVCGRNEILLRIADDVKNERCGRILLVPELISHDMERRLCETAGDTSSRFAEVLSFTRMAKRVADMAGSAAVECLDDGGRVVAMAAAARQLHSKLKAYASVETKPEFLTELVDAVDEFKRCCISAGDLKAASAQTQGSFAQKLEELSLLLETYDSLCARGKRDPRDQMNWLLEQLEDNSYGEEHVFYIDGFPDFTRQHMEILAHLIAVSPCVTVSLNCDCVDSSKMAFEKAGQTAAEFICYAQKKGVNYQIEVMDPGCHSLEMIRELLFQGPVKKFDGIDERLHLFKADSIYQECTEVAGRIMDLVRNGCRFRDIGVVCTDIQAYQNVIDLVFRRFHIPLYQSGTEDILQKSVIATVLHAMDAALGGFDQKDVIRYLKSALSPLTLEESDKIENYAIMWGISGKKWESNWENHPEGLGQDWTDQAIVRLAELNEIRKKAIEPLGWLCKEFRRAGNMAQQIRALYGFLERINLAVRLDNLASSYDLHGDTRTGQILSQLWEILLGAMEQMHDVLGETAWDEESFTRLFTLLLSQYDVGTIPQVLDAVTAGPVSAMRCQEVSHLFIMGASEGSLPGYGGSKGVLTDQERDALRMMGVPLTGGSLEGLQAEFAEIYGVVCGTQESITISYSSGQPSFVYRRMAALVGGEEISTNILSAATADPEEAASFLLRFGGEREAADLGLGSAYEEAYEKVSYTAGLLSEDTVRKLYGKKLRLSASQVDKFAECRMAYFLRYGLRAQERKEITVDPAEFGTYVHAVLEHTGRKVMEEGGFHNVSAERTWEIALEYSRQYAQERFAQLDSQRLEYLFHRNAQELEMIVRELWEELSVGEFAPVGFEVGFGDGKEMPAIEIGGKMMEAQLRGFVDRVDQWGQYFRVVDYKTGRKDIDYCDLFNGIGLQMLLYLFALEQAGSRILGDTAFPAGVQYFPARAPYLVSDGFLTEEEAMLHRAKEWKRNGLLLHDEAVLGAMEPEEGSQRLCCKRNKDGTLSGDLADREQLRQLKSYILRILGFMTDEIASGKISPNPYTRGSAHNACTYCPFGPVCHPGEVEERRNYKAMTAQRFWEEIGKELKDRG